MRTRLARRAVISRLLPPCAAAFALLACDSTVPVTTDLCGGHGEFENTLTIGPSGGYDLVFVIEPELVERVSGWVEAVVRQLITGDADSDGRQDHHAETFLRVAVRLPDEVPALLAALTCDAQPDATCPSTELAHAAYRYHPYGFGDDPEAFLESVRCLLANAGRTSECAQALEAASAPESIPFTQGWTEIVVVTDRGVCAEGDPGCPADPLRALLAGDGLRHRVTWVTGVPADALDAGELIERTYFACGVHADAGTWTFDIDDLRFGADGRAHCDLLETLPADGPITHCEQLVAFGRRAADDVAHELGPETCRLDQLVIDGDAPPSGYGFFLAPARTETPEDRAPVRTDFSHPCFGVIDGPGARFELTPETELVTGSTLTLRCELSYGRDAGCD